MAPIKFEEQLKDKLEKRSLQPSAESWAKLSQRLDAEEKKSRKPVFWWMGIAASIIILIVAATQVFSTNENESVETFIVEEDIKENNEINKQSIIEDEKPTKIAVEESEAISESKEENLEKQAQIINHQKLTKSNDNAKEQLANTRLDVSEEEKLNQLRNEQKSIIQEATINKEDLANVIKELNSESTKVTDREVDSLLKVASKELFKDKLKKESLNTVDANQLLMEVEDEMGQSFRTKVYEALKESYETVKTAVAERNN